MDRNYKSEYIRMGKEDYEAGVPCQPAKSKRLMEKFKAETCEIGSALSMQHLEEARLWTLGWKLSEYIGKNYVGA